MPYRDSEHTELCAVCRAPSDLGCERCGEPHCQTHQHEDGRRCDPCESDYLARETRGIATFVVVAVGLCAVGILIAGVAVHFYANGIIGGAGARAVPSLAMATIVVLLVVFVSPPLIRRRLRGKFLRERTSFAGRASAPSAKAAPATPATSRG